MWEIIVPILVIVVVVILVLLIMCSSTITMDLLTACMSPTAFIIIWIVIYALLLYAWVRGLYNAPNMASGQIVSIFFVISMVLNVVWFVALFNTHEPSAALLLLILLIVIGVALIAALGYDLCSSFLVAVYVLWLVYALIMNAQYAPIGP